jgi:hypothetical protein
MSKRKPLDRTGHREHLKKCCYPFEPCSCASKRKKLDKLDPDTVAKCVDIVLTHCSASGFCLGIGELCI